MLVIIHYIRIILLTYILHIILVRLHNQYIYIYLSHSIVKLVLFLYYNVRFYIILYIGTIYCIILHRFEAENGFNALER